MGQKTHPIGFRLGITKGWDSNWFHERSYADNLFEDYQIREYIMNRFPNGDIEKILIGRTSTDHLHITIYSAKPGVVIGKGGQEVESLKQELMRLLRKIRARRSNSHKVKRVIKLLNAKKETSYHLSAFNPFKDEIKIHIEVGDVKKPEISASLVARRIAQQLRARISFRRAMKQAISAAMRAGAKGIKISCSGRLGGVDMARRETYSEGRVPLSTLRADIDYAYVPAPTIYGIIGVKVWIYKGDLYGKVDLFEHFLGDKTTGGYKRR